MLEMVKNLPREVQAAFGAVALVAVVGVVGWIVQSNAHRDATAAWQEERANLAQRVGELQTEGDDLKATVEEQAGRIAELEASNADLMKAHGTISAVQAEALAASSKLAGITGSIAENESKLKLVGRQLASTQTSLLRTTRRQQAALDDTKDLGANRARLQNLRADVYAGERELQLLGRRLATGQVGLQKATFRQRQLREETDLLETKRAALGQVGGELDTKTRQLKGVARRLAVVQVGLNATIKRQRKAEETTDELLARQAWLGQVVADIGAKERRLAVVGHRLSVSQASLDRAYTRHRRVADETEAMRGRLNQVRARLGTLQQRISTVQDEVRDLDVLVGAGAALIN